MRSLGPAVVPFDELPALRRALAVATAILQGQASTVQRVNAQGAGRRARRALATWCAATHDRPDLLIIDHLQAYSWVAGRAAERGADLPPIVLVMHNLEPAGYAERGRRQSGRGVASALRRLMLEREAGHLHELETAALRHAAAVACLSEEDAEYFRDRARACGSRAGVFVLPGYPLCAPAGPAPAQPVGAVRRVGMIGTWTWGPNRDALRWMLERVVPLWPDGCQLVLAGGGLEGWPLPARVVSLGRVEDVSDFYASVDLLAVPSVHGSGVQEKAIEAVGSGHSLVATPHALRGLDPGLPANVHRADDPAQFARLCAEVAVEPAALQREQLLRWMAGRRSHYAAAVAACVASSMATRALDLRLPPSGVRSAKTA
jgi:hypothetical protein